MAFKITAEHRVWWPVSVPVPQDDGGVRKHTFKVQFLVLPKSRIDALQAEAMAAIERQGRGDETARDDADFQGRVLREAVQDWKDLVDDEDETVPYGPAVLAGLLDVPYVRNAMFTAYGEASAGRKAGN
jgi:hypothetical protein